MSSEYSIHLGDKAIEGRVQSLSPEVSSTVVRLTVGNEDGALRHDTHFVLYVPDGRRLEVGLLLHEIAAGLMPRGYSPYLPTEDASEAAHSAPRWHI